MIGKSAAVSVLTLALFAQRATDKPLQRTTNGSVLKSTTGIPITLTLAQPFHYLGGQRFDLYGKADAEQHFFVQADSKRRIWCAYWIQFETFLPKIEEKYDYSEDPFSIIAGTHEWRAVVGGGLNKEYQGKPDGDIARFKLFLAAKGFQLPDDQLRVRLTTVSSDKRSEVMIVYIEDANNLGVKSADLESGGKAEARWPEIEMEMLARAKKGITLQ